MRTFTSKTLTGRTIISCLSIYFVIIFCLAPTAQAYTNVVWHNTTTFTPCNSDTLDTAEKCLRNYYATHKQCCWVSMGWASSQSPPLESRSFSNDISSATGNLKQSVKMTGLNYNYATGNTSNSGTLAVYPTPSGIEHFRTNQHYYYDPSSWPTDPNGKIILRRVPVGTGQCTGSGCLPATATTPETGVSIDFRWGFDGCFSPGGEISFDIQPSVQSTVDFDPNLTNTATVQDITNSTVDNTPPFAAAYDSTNTFSSATKSTFLDYNYPSVTYTFSLGDVDPCSIYHNAGMTYTTDSTAHAIPHWWLGITTGSYATEVSVADPTNPSTGDIGIRTFTNLHADINFCTCGSQALENDPMFKSTDSGLSAGIHQPFFTLIAILMAIWFK